MELGKPFPASETHGLVDKVDVLAEIPVYGEEAGELRCGHQAVYLPDAEWGDAGADAAGQEVVEVKGTFLRSILLSVVERQVQDVYTVRFRNLMLFHNRMVVFGKMSWCASCMLWSPV